ncbi:MAG: tRNA epoxyqueuosine(34) reductase QueG [Marinilabiliales bacterium]|nr:MAG: tRNA epoxyqueuosine(34) reductase QueG [Marinilabiliales bacterium]
MQDGFLTKKLLSDFIKKEALNSGFFDCGISPVKHLPYDEKRMEMWLTDNMNAGMSYLERNKEKRYNPALLVENSKSIISVLYSYLPEKIIDPENNFRISKYAYGKDYHYVIKDKLRVLANEIEKKAGKFNYRVFVDSAPVLDRAWARESGLGFTGKNTSLINKKGGSYFFIGHIICDLDLDYESKAVANSCGTCTKCIQACPTDALQPFKLDANKCISYLTIENKGEIPNEFKGKMNNFIFGCDICTDVCPWNRFAKPTKEIAFKPKEELMTMRKNDWIDLDKSKFNKLFKGTAFERAGFDGLKRNINFVKES